MKVDNDVMTLMLFLGTRGIAKRFKRYYPFSPAEFSIEAPTPR